MKPDRTTASVSTEALGLPGSGQDEFEAFEASIVRIFDPQTAVERLAVSDVARARYALENSEAKYEARLELEAIQAPARRERELLDDYFRLLRMWRKNPYAANDSFTQNLHAVRHLAHIWEQIAEDHAPDGAGSTMERAIDALLSQLQPWKAQEMTEKSWWLMTRLLACSPYAEELISDWLKKSGLTQKSGFREVIREKLSAQTELGRARRELIETARREAARWHALAEELKLEHESEKKFLSSIAMGIGARGETAALRTARSILKYHREQVEKAEKHLLQLQQHRQKTEALQARSAMKSQTETIPLQAASSTRPTSEVHQNSTQGRSSRPLTTGAGSANQFHAPPPNLRPGAGSGKTAGIRSADQICIAPA